MSVLAVPVDTQRVRYVCRDCTAPPETFLRTDVFAIRTFTRKHANCTPKGRAA